MHSNRSDGRLSCAEVLVEASKKQLDIICISDRDLAPILDARVYSDHGHDVRVIHGAEMSVNLSGEEQHFGLFSIINARRISSALLQQHKLVRNDMMRCVTSLTQGVRPMRPREQDRVH